MAQGVTLKNPIWESHLFRGRTIIAAAAAILMILIIIARLFYLQVISHSHYTTLSDNNRVDTLPIVPTRGLIYDRNGIILAENLPRYSLDLVPERVEDMEITLKSIRELIEISDSELKRFRKYLKHKRRFEAIPLRFQLSDEEVAKIAVNLHQLAGVEINSRLSRHYPLGTLMAHSVGYIGRMDVNDLQKVDSSNYSATTHVGKTGVERSYEKILHGQVGHQRVETNARGRILRVLERTAPVPGNNLTLNIDARLQKTAEKAFASERGALVAIEPETGAVLSLISTPSYDPNLFVNGIDTQTYQAISQSPDQPLFNRALQGQYPPGSTTKPFVGLMGLESKIITPKHKVDCHGSYMLKNDDRRYRDWKKEGHGSTNLYQAIKHSCDVYFYDLSLN
ncbi:MAG: penicillin-binding protein 2, partial [Gammaproteobacteria bacterium]|nr:penicillin-binding protein 2 [Gammaproteobacteria bacterium]